MALQSAPVVVVVRGVRDVNGVWLSSPRLLPAHDDITTEGARGFIPNPLALSVSWIEKDFLSRMPRDLGAHGPLLMIAASAHLGVATPLLGLHRGPDPARPEVVLVDLVAPGDLHEARLMAIGTSDHLELCPLRSAPSLEALQSLVISQDFGVSAMTRAFGRLVHLGYLSEESRSRANLTPGFFLAVAGFVTGYVLVQGKVTFAWEPFLPVTFELGVLLTAFTCVFGMMALNGLPRFHHPLFGKRDFLKTSDDVFVIAIEAEDPSFDPEKTRELLESIGGSNSDLVEDED